MGYDLKGILVFNLKYEHAISFINLVKFIIKCQYHNVNSAYENFESEFISVINKHAPMKKKKTCR